MARVLLYGIPLHAAGSGLARSAVDRYQPLIDALRDARLEVVVAGPPDEADDGRGVEGVAADGVTWRVLLAGQDGQGEVLDDITRDVTPDSVVVCGALAASAYAPVPSMPPTWVDLPDDLVPPAAGSTAEATETYWQRLGSVLARSDRFSCATAAQAAQLWVHLGVRGRAEVTGDLVVAIAEPSSAGWRALCAWTLDPRPGPPARPAAGSREAELARRVADLEQQLAVVEGARIWRLRGVALAGRRRLGAGRRALTRLARALLGGMARVLRWLVRGQAWVADRLLDALVWLALLPGTLVTMLAARWRRRTPVTLARPDEAVRAPVPAGARKPRMLMVCPYPIHPPNHGGGVRLFNLIRHLSRGCDLFLLVLIRGDDDPEQRAALAPYCQRIDFHRWDPGAARRKGRLAPPSVSLFYDPRLAMRIRDLAAIHAVDVLHLEYTEMGQYAPVVEALDGVRVVLVEIDVAFRSLQRRRQLAFRKRYPVNRAYGQSFGDWMRLLRFEVRACRAADEVQVMSPEDGAYLASFLPDAGGALAGGAECGRYRGLPAARGGVVTRGRVDGRQFPAHAERRCFRLLHGRCLAADSAGRAGCHTDGGRGADARSNS